MVLLLDILTNPPLGAYLSGLFLYLAINIFHSPLIPVFLFSPQSLHVFDLRATYKPHTTADKGVDFPGFQI